MIGFFEGFQGHVSATPGKVALPSMEDGGDVTYGELDQLSGRVYCCLRERGIVRKDMVCIALSRGVEPLVAMLSVWKAWDE